MKNTEKIKLLDKVEEIFRCNDLLRQEVGKAKKAISTVDKAEKIMVDLREELREMIDMHGILYIEMDGQVYRISRFPSNFKNVLIEDITIYSQQKIKNHEKQNVQKRFVSNNNGV